MDEATDLKPRISVILPALLGYESVRVALESWEAQSKRREIEILVLCPDVPRAPLPHGQRVIKSSHFLHMARAAAVRSAQSDYVLFAEDHCLPDRDCIEVLLTRLDENWDAIGPALRPGTPGIISEGSFLISYGQWMSPKGGGVAYLPGHNVVLRKQVLMDLGDELERELVTAMFLMRRLRSEGCSFLLEERARMRHFDVPEWRKSLRIFYAVGQGCGAIRHVASSRPVRALHGLAIPFTAARHFGRGVVQYPRIRSAVSFPLSAIAVGAVFAAAWAIGESVGAFRGLERVMPDLWESEIKPVSAAQEAASR